MSLAFCGFEQLGREIIRNFLVGSIESFGCSENKTVLGNRSHDDGKDCIVENYQRSEYGKLLVHGVRDQVAPDEVALGFQVDLGLEDDSARFLERICARPAVGVEGALVVSESVFLDLDYGLLIQVRAQDRVLRLGFVSLKFLRRIPTLGYERPNEHPLRKRRFLQLDLQSLGCALFHAVNYLLRISLP